VAVLPVAGAIVAVAATWTVVVVSAVDYWGKQQMHAWNSLQDERLAMQLQREDDAHSAATRHAVPAQEAALLLSIADTGRGSRAGGSASVGSNSTTSQIRQRFAAATPT
jgi:hypothetical protein